ncbi:MAG: hypothetical protein ACRDCT_03795 [Shewanella sp.]|uniref:hypothetical protein n=1 Tax=Aeromonas TaxID=642 RepID=UPI001881ED2A|nr:hypothetical protein [Aeromonas veronii]MBE8733918.1 hypothetical protein [Aeromonas veronii]MBE8738309.1 hypothetical protein [Aeromonas veronii]MBE8741904.1 hypothetical protein [Aeromonas veronii]MBE8763254.1 hypothetical protein [Aeromonas veronii]MBE8837866.1 hypothetical protein [Aeromonas veronii]
MHSNTLFLLPRDFFLRQLFVMLCWEVLFGFLIINYSKLSFNAVDARSVTLMVLAGVFLILYPHSRYATQKIIDFMIGADRLQYSSVPALFERKMGKSLVSLVLILILGPANIVAMCIQRLRSR